MSARAEVERVRERVAGKWQIPLLIISVAIGYLAIDGIVQRSHRISTEQQIKQAQVLVDAGNLEGIHDPAHHPLPGAQSGDVPTLERDRAGRGFDATAGPTPARRRRSPGTFSASRPTESSATRTRPSCCSIG